MHTFTSATLHEQELHTLLDQVIVRGTALRMMCEKRYLGTTLPCCIRHH